MFPSDIVKVDIKPIIFNNSSITEVYIDLAHINRGKDKKFNRSSFEIKDILKFVFLLNDLNIQPEMMRGNYLYFSQILKDELDRPYKIVFCQDYSSSWIGVITLFRVRERHENKI